VSSTQIKNELTVSCYEVVQDAYKPSPYECEGAVFSSSEMRKVRASINSDFSEVLQTASWIWILRYKDQDTGCGMKFSFAKIQNL